MSHNHPEDITASSVFFGIIRAALGIPMSISDNINERLEDHPAINSLVQTGNAAITIPIFAVLGTAGATLVTSLYLILQLVPEDDGEAEPAIDYDTMDFDI